MTAFTEISLLVVIAALVAFIARLLKQPLIIGHIITGFLVGPLFLDLIQSQETVHLFSEIGIAFLLFIVGLNLTPHTIRQFGTVAVITGAGQVLLTSLTGFLVGLALGFSPLVAGYLGVALAFSSTIIILKLLSDRGDTDKLYGKISIGFLLVQDIIAIALLFIIPLIARGGDSGGNIIAVLAQGVVFTILVFLVAFRFLPRLDRVLGRSQELRFLFSIAWGLGLATLFQRVGFSLESGALIAGVALSVLPSRHEINARLKPLRDFFIILFFILLGSQIAVSNITAVLIPALILSALVLIGNPLIVMTIMGALGYRKKTSFQTGLTVAQISEFSLIIVALGVSVGHLTSPELSLITLVGIITIFGSTYLILYSDKIYPHVRRALSIFERKHLTERREREKKYEFVLFGQNRIGYDFVTVFKKSNRPFFVIDYDPEVINWLKEQGIDNEYGDASDVDFLQSLNLGHLRLAASTVPDRETNIIIIHEVKQRTPAAAVMAVAHTIEEALALYAEGADYVIMPHFLGGKYASLIAGQLHAKPAAFARLREEHIAYLHERKALGHEHPVLEKLR